MGSMNHFLHRYHQFKSSEKYSYEEILKYLESMGEDISQFCEEKKEDEKSE